MNKYMYEKKLFIELGSYCVYKGMSSCTCTDTYILIYYQKY